MPLLLSLLREFLLAKPLAGLRKLGLWWVVGLGFLGCPAKVAPAPPVGLRAEAVTGGWLEGRLATADGADLVILYGSEEKGSMEPCGCEEAPMGGLARAGRYAGAVADREPGVLYLNAGKWAADAMDLDGNPRADMGVANRGMMEGLRRGGVDALNLSWSDITGLRSLDGRTAVPVVSAQVRGPGVLPWLIVEQNGRKIGITGITAPGSRLVSQPGYTLGDPHTDARPVLEALRGKVDLVVLLSQDAPEAAKKLALAGLVDVVIDAGGHHGRFEPVRVGQAVWVKSWAQSERLGELRLGLNEKGALEWAIDRKIDLDPLIGEDAGLSAYVRQAKKEQEAAHEAVFGESN
jgi:hypothetical protein